MLSSLIILFHFHCFLDIVDCGTTFLPPASLHVQGAALNAFNFLYCRGSCDSFPPVANSCQGESIRTTDPYSVKVDIDYNTESKSCGFGKHAASLVLTCFHTHTAISYFTAGDGIVDHRRVSV